MGTVLLVVVVVLVVAALVFGVVSMLTGDDPGLSPVDPDGRAVPLPNTRSLAEADLKSVRFDVTLRGYRMSQVDRALRRTAYDIGYKDEMIAVLEAEVTALRDGRIEDAELLSKAREAAANPAPDAVTVSGTATPDSRDTVPDAAGPSGVSELTPEPTDLAAGDGPAGAAGGEPEAVATGDPMGEAADQEAALPEGTATGEDTAMGEEPAGETADRGRG
jgi:DivIVA domain-containing protein